MDREHPIPQEVSTYEFRLVGDMTIKQFMQVAAGALISLLLYSSGLAPYVKWPLIVISFLVGIALAFFPIEDRPLSKWIVLFVKAIYSPTIYVWDKNASRHQFFQPESADIALPTIPEPSGISNINAPTTSLAAQPVSIELEKLEKTEEQFLSKVSSQFNSPNSSLPVNTTTATVAPVAQTPPVQLSQQSQKIDVPKVVTPKVEPASQQIPSQSIYQSQSTVGTEITPSATQDLGNAKAALFSEDASPPSPPTRANVVVGQVLNPEGKIIDGAILEIKDASGRSVRALRSNRLGHFMIVTPLANGQYQITVEKEGFQFDPVTFDAGDRIIPPIAIWARGES